MAEGVSGAVLLGFIFYNSIIGAVPAAVFVPFYIHIRRKIILKGKAENT